MLTLVTFIKRPLSHIVKLIAVFKTCNPSNLEMKSGKLEKIDM